MPTDEPPRRWSASDEAGQSHAGRGFPPGWPLGVSHPAPRRIEVEPEVIPPVPAPTSRAREIPLADMPAGARNIANAALGAGFHLKNTYAQGPRLDKDNRVIEVSESVLVRAAHPDGRKVLACWTTKTAVKGVKAGQTRWSFDFGYVTNPHITPADSAALRTYMLPVSTPPKKASPHP